MRNLCDAVSVSEFVRRNPDAESQLFSVFVRRCADAHQRQLFSEFVRKSADVASVSFLVSLSANVRTYISFLEAYEVSA